ncbi:hypothetical protein NPIL_274461 [Nephila pilipes]|uniref:Uncharacterized protein n=1 Tax=Nephila pilipes TaxID=299642 RepID=A0A8X6TLD7_NEPPI|nr:hypothetical protein NPIL_274461 [Nephila pilipes]
MFRKKFHFRSPSVTEELHTSYFRLLILVISQQNVPLACVTPLVYKILPVTWNGSGSRDILSPPTRARGTFYRPLSRTVFEIYGPCFRNGEILCK